jgi:hypothetical protein
MFVTSLFFCLCCALIAGARIRIDPNQKAGINFSVRCFALQKKFIGKNKREGALGTKVRGCSYFEGDASHTAHVRPLG